MEGRHLDFKDACEARPKKKRLGTEALNQRKNAKFSVTARLIHKCVNY